MYTKKCTACAGEGEVRVGTHEFPRFGVLAMSADCQVCDGKGVLKPKTKLRKKGAKKCQESLKPIVTKEDVNSVLGLGVLIVE